MNLWMLFFSAAVGKRWQRLAFRSSSSKPLVFRHSTTQQHSRSRSTTQHSNSRSTIQHIPSSNVRHHLPSFFCHKLCAGKCWVKLKFCLPNICWPATVVGRVKICVLLEIRRVAVLPISVAVAKQAVFGELGAACWSTEMVLLPRQSNGTWNFLKMGKEEILGGLMDWKEYLVEEDFYIWRIQQKVRFKSDTTW